MQVILVKDVDNLGQIGDIVNVKPGYARNFLLPKKFAIAASHKNTRRLEHEKRIAEFKAVKAREADQSIAEKISGREITLNRKTGEQDKLYGSVTAIDIEQALAAEGLEISRRKIQLPEPIKALGTYDVTIRLRRDLSTDIKVTVAAE